MCLTVVYVLGNLTIYLFLTVQISTVNTLCCKLLLPDTNVNTYLLSINCVKADSTVTPGLCLTGVTLACDHHIMLLRQW